jgi:hypothetical protein
MSLRLNNAIGYALTDLVPNDPRVNHDSVLLSWPQMEEEDEDFVAPNFEDYAAWLQQAAADGTGGFGTRIEATLLGNVVAKSPGRPRLTDAVIYQQESDAEVLLLIPPIYVQAWSRRDDSIDYAQARLLPDRGLGNKLVHFKVGLGVYSSRFMHLDGTDLSDAAAEFMQLADAGMPTDELDNIAPTIRPLQWSDERQMYANAADAFAGIVPTVPSDLRRLSEYGQLFTGPDVWKQLRPVLYTYWS